MTPPDKRTNRLLVVLFVSMLLLTVINGLFANYRAQQASRTLCPLIVLFDTIYQSQPPTTDTGKTVAAAMHLAAGNCPKESTNAR